MEAMLNVSGNVIRQDESGVWRIGATRVSLDSVLYAFHEGASAEEIALRFQTLSLPQVYSVISYYLQNQAELDEYLQTRRQTRAALRAGTEARFPPHGIRERLLARRENRK